MKVRLEDQFDGEAGGLGVLNVFVDVAARVDDHGTAGGFVADQIGGLGKALQVVLSEDHFETLILRILCTDIIPPRVFMSNQRAWAYPAERVNDVDKPHLIGPTRCGNR